MWETCRCSWSCAVHLLGMHKLCEHAARWRRLVGGQTGHWVQDHRPGLNTWPPVLVRSLFWTIQRRYSTLNSLEQARGREAAGARGQGGFKGNYGGPMEGGLNIGQHEGLNM